MPPNNNHRGIALAKIRSTLFDLMSGEGLIHVTFTGQRHKPYRLVWPEDRAGKEAVFVHLSRILEECERSAEVKAKQDGARRGQVIVMQWPASPDLFEVVHPPEPSAEPVSESRSATGQTVSTETVPTSPTTTMALVKKGPGHERASEECARHILRLLYEEQRRMTGDALTDAMNTHSEVFPWSKRSIEHALSWLRGLTLIDNASDGKGRGYGLVNWSVDPVPPPAEDESGDDEEEEDQPS